MTKKYYFENSPLLSDDILYFPLPSEGEGQGEEDKCMRFLCGYYF